MNLTRHGGYDGKGGYKMRNEARIEKAKEILFSNTPADRIIETYVGSDFIEFIVSAGGDVLTYRIYNNGKVYER